MIDRWGGEGLISATLQLQQEGRQGAEETEEERRDKERTGTKRRRVLRSDICRCIIHSLPLLANVLWKVFNLSPANCCRTYDEIDGSF